VSNFLGIELKNLSNGVNMDKEKIKTLIDNLEMEVNNGGFDQFFFNSAGDNAHETVEALKIIGAFHTANIVQNAINKFPNNIVPKDRYERQDILEKVSPDCDAFEVEDKQFYEYQDNLSGLLEKFLANNK